MMQYLIQYQLKFIILSIMAKTYTMAPMWEVSFLQITIHIKLQEFVHMLA